MSSKSRLQKGAAEPGNTQDEPEKSIPAAHRIAFNCPDRLIDQHELEIRIGEGKTAIFDKLADPSSGLPRPIKHGRVNRWLLREVNDYIAKRVAERDADLGVAA